MNSCLYECTVMHHRFSPKTHHFEHRIFMFYLDLDELKAISGRVWPFSHNRANFYSFRDLDHQPAGAAPMKDRLIAYLRQNGINCANSCRVMLLTFPRILGYVFNPISVYFIFDSAGQPVVSVAEVENTFAEKKLYIVRADGSSTGAMFKEQVVKHFYVSPFAALNLHFHFEFRVPGDTLAIKVDDHEGGQKTLASTLTGRRSELTNRALLWFSFKYPLVTLKVIFLIHWHALLLWLKGVPFGRKADNPRLQQDVLNPHSTLLPRTK